ncbi:hypothetical protein MTES_2527 [Microbacterium testaceum StLB037]|uniref:Uncharacterized protein n=2 Tax=Microbacterium testaceum TaxID=2033 RepID=E8N759_MICTS|nr:hypothetical protein MTES_2527 [Microbacterium testaceum StLB037]
MELSRRSMLVGTLSVLGLGAGSVAAASLMTHGGPEKPLVGPHARTASPSATATATPTPTRSAADATEDLRLHAWDSVVRQISDAADATVTLASGALPAGVGLSSGRVIGRPTTEGAYRFALDVREGKKKRLRTFAGTVAPLKRDLNISLSLDQRTPMSVTAKEFDRIARLGANATLVIYCFISDPTSTTFTRVSDDRIDKAFQLARDRGIRITLVKPHIVTDDQGDGFYRGNYAPASLDAFFANWQAQLQYFATLCAQNDVEYLALTCEQPAQTDASTYDRWVPLIQKLRDTEPGVKLTAAFTTLELFLLYTYWIPQSTPHMARLLDVFGINSWIRLTDKVYTPDAPNITVDELVAGWRGGGGRTDDHLGKLEAVCDGLRIPFFITEVGVQPRVDGLAKQDNNSPATGAEDFDVQALLYQSVLQAPLQSRWCTGASIWHMRAPFAFGLLNGKRLFPGENVLKTALADTPALATKSF